MKRVLDLNGDMKRAREKIYRDKNREKLRAKGRSYYEENKEERRARARATSKKIKGELHDRYIIELIRESDKRAGVFRAEIPQEEIEERRQLIIKRRNRKRTRKAREQNKRLATARRKEARDKKKRELQEMLVREGITIHQHHYSINKEDCKAAVRKNYYKHRDKKIRKRLRYKERMGDGYMKELLIRGTSLMAADIPQELVEIKRLQLQLIRMSKDKRSKQCQPKTQ